MKEASDVKEHPYEVDLDLGDDPQATEIAQRQWALDSDYNILDYEFEAEDSRGRLGIEEGLRAEHLGVAVPRQRWGGERSAEEEALNVVLDPDTLSDRPPEGHQD